MEELKSNDNLVKEENVTTPENRESEIQEFTQMLMQLNEEYTKENCEEQPGELLAQEKSEENIEANNHEDGAQEQPAEESVDLLTEKEQNIAESDAVNDENEVKQQSLFDESSSEKGCDEKTNDDLVEKQAESENANSESVLEKEETSDNHDLTNESEAKQIENAFKKQAEDEEVKQKEKVVESDDFCEVEYKQIKLQKIYNKIAYDLTSPSLTTNVLKERILDATDYLFHSYMLLTSKIKGLKKAVKESNKMCAVIGLGESTSLAKRWEIRQAKSLKVGEIQVIMPLSIIKEGKKRLIQREFLEYKRIIGDKIVYTVAIDGENLTNDEFSMAVECSIGSGAKKIYLKNAQKISQAKLLFAVKACADKCKVQVDFAISRSDEIKRHNERGVDIFVVENAIALAESIKHEE